MEESEENMSSENVKKVDSSLSVKKPKKRSMVERELETNMTARVTSPVIVEGISTSRYGRPRRLKTEAELIETQKVLLASIKSPSNENTPVKINSPVYRMHASNSPHKAETPKKPYLENQIDNIYQENISLSRFSDDTVPSPAKKFPKVYIRKDLIQNREEDEPVMLIKNLFSPTKSASKSSNGPDDSSVLSTEKHDAKKNGLIDNSSVVKTLDFDENKKKKIEKDKKISLSNNDLFELEAKCPYQVGDLAWARVGSFPFWPCIITRDPYSKMFVKKKLFGRVEHDIFHVTFFGDNGRRSWIVNKMLRPYSGLLEFGSTREKFTPEDKKKDPRLYAAFFISEKKQPLWNMSVEEAETLLREPKRLRIDIFNDMLWKIRDSKKPLKSGKISSRTNSDVSLSESLYDSLFSEPEIKTDDPEHSKKSKNKSFDVSEVVTACLDNMAAKTGITKIQRQSHMDRWLQKAKSKTPEKTQAKAPVLKVEKPEKAPIKSSAQVMKKSSTKVKTKSPVPSSSGSHAKPYKFRKNESHSKLTVKEGKNGSNVKGKSSPTTNRKKNKSKSAENNSANNSDLNVTANVHEKIKTDHNILKVIIIDDENQFEAIKSENEPLHSTVDDSAMDTVEVEEAKFVTDKVTNVDMTPTDDDLNESKYQVNLDSTADEANYTPANAEKAEIFESHGNKTIDISSVDTAVASNNFNAEIQSIQSTQLLETAEEVDKNTLASKDQNSDTNDMHAMETAKGLSKKRLSVAVEAKTKISVSDKSQDSLMEVDKNTTDFETARNKSEELLLCDPVNNSVMEVDKSTNFEGQANEDTSPISKTVSNKSVEDNVVTNLKEALNVVTIEVSVTEKNNDDTLNKLQDGEHGSIDELNSSEINETKVETLSFLDMSKNLTKDIAETTKVLDLQNSSTPEKYETLEAMAQKSRTITKKKFNFESKAMFTNSNDFFRNEKELIELKDKIKESPNKILHKMENGNHLINNDKTIDPRNNVLNKSANSDSIKQLCTDDPEIEKGEAILETSITDSSKSESILEISKDNANVREDVSMRKTVGSDIMENETEFVANENHNDSTRQYVESPTFTQLLESEEFFRDVNDTHNTSANLETEISRDEENRDANSELCPEPKEITANEIRKSRESVESTKFSDIFDEEEETSEDEPSPEYESLDDEITEDFRKHMMSIESNIKDKKDEEQIVKICNEIAEKAKLSPIKYIEVELTAKPMDKVDINSKSVSRTSDEHHQIVDKHCINLLDRLDTENRNKLKAFRADFTKGLIRPQKRMDIPTDVVSEKHENTKIYMNGNADLHEIAGKPKIVYRTRSSVGSVSKERASPDIKMESSQTDQYRKSCEYEPKVVIIRLERDNKIEYKIAPSKKSLEEETSKNNHKSRISVSDSVNDKHTENQIIEHAEDKSKNRKSKEIEDKIINKKSRLSLRRDSPKRKQVENQDIQCQSEIIINNNEIENLTAEPFKNEESEITATRVPNKIEIKNDTHETEISQPLKMNGFHHHLDRKYTDTPDLISDTDFDVDAVSLNSEDSDVSLPNSVDSIPKRSLRSRPERTLECALRNPEFLKYLELRQDYLMDIHPELNEDEVVAYVHKTWQYEEDLKSETKKTEEPRNNLIKQDTLRNRKSKKPQSKNSIENYFREKYEKSRKTIDFDSETGTAENSIEVVEQKPDLLEEEKIVEENMSKKAKRKKRSKSPDNVDLTSDTSNNKFLINNKYENVETVVKTEENMTTRTSSESRMTSISFDGETYVENTHALEETLIKEQDFDAVSIDSEDSEIPLRLLRSKALNENRLKKEAGLESKSKEPTQNNEVKKEAEETALVLNNEPLVKQRKKKADKNSVDDPEFLQFVELRQDALVDENPQLSQDEIVRYLHKIWIYEESSKSAIDKNDELEQEVNLQLNTNDVTPAKKPRGRPKIEKKTDDSKVAPKEKLRRTVVKPFYNENYSDIEDELEVFEIFKTKKSAITVVSKAETEKDKSPNKSSKESPKVTENIPEEVNDRDDDVEYLDDTEIYFTQLTQPKPNVFKGLIREKICEICECTGNLVKCKGCYGMFHPDCVKKQAEPTEKLKESDLLLRGRKKKRKTIRKLRGLEDSESHGDEKPHDLSADTSVEDIVPADILPIDADYFETQLEIKMKEMLDAADVDCDSYSSDEGADWGETVAGRCEIVDVKRKRRDPPVDHSDFKCNNCRTHDVPLCCVCKSAASKTGVETRQKCHVAHCHRYYHLECLEQWPQTQFNSREVPRRGKQSAFSESFSCPRHVCHSCVSDDPRGCRTRFSGDKLARCARCPATYHAFNKCLPAGSTVLTASHIICPRHGEQRAGKVPCHVNTGWCFICALGGSLICCEYCPTSFHAECLNIKPPEGNYMCEDCETGRLPLYGEMVWVKLGQYRWWPGIILHPSEIPENIMQVKHEPGDFVVRFFGQYDHYWVNRGRVFPYQEGDSGRISSQKSKINEDFILAIEHAQRAYTILKNAEPDEEESQDIASSLLPPHYVKLKSNKPSGSLCGRKMEDPSLSLTQCECNPDEPEPCGPYSQCLNRMLLTECGPSCRAGERCNNRAFERRLYPPLAPYRTPQRGWGLKTLEHIKAGQFVIEYVGELIDEEEFRRRMRRKHETRDENYYFLTLDKERMIDAGPKGNVARFMNHCCEPNCETQKWTVLGDVRVGLFAIDDIPANSEVTFNYNLECAGIDKKRCLCGAPRCSGYMGAKPKQDDSQSKKGKLKRTYNKKKKPEESPSTNKVKKKLGRPPKPKELTDLEKDVLIIKNATNLSSDESKTEDKTTTKRKNSCNPTEQVSLCNGEDTVKTLKRKRVSISTEEVSIFKEQEPCVKKLKCDKPSEVGD